ncbi:MAG: FAD-linked oxidase [Chloroflexi bacterium RBG_13_68_17]|nr:MAG: FAD-linked oxidase [Chloroflexi bacterium RBG_13_68_17]
MRRWNGWGDAATDYPLPDSAARYLETLIGPGVTTPDAPFESVVAGVPPARLAPHPLIRTDPAERVLHARGHSLPDWVALRSGRVGIFPDGVAYPASDDDLRTLFDYAEQNHARLIPYGGGTSVVGHINPLPGPGPVLTIDLGTMRRMLNLDSTSRLATFEAGIPGPQIEAELGRQGYTLGHFPQSFELSTLGGWIATRSSGQQSYHYGRIEDLFAGGHLETPAGPLDLPPHPASAAGPDLRHLVLGSEGRLGVISRAVVRVRPLPEKEAFFGVFFRDWDSGAEAVRTAVQADLSVSMLRFSDAQETATTLALSGKETLVTWADRGLRLLRYDARRCLLVFGVTGSHTTARRARREAVAIALRHGGLPTGTAIGRIWRKSRFRTPYLRNTLWERGYAIDTLETAIPWATVLGTAESMKAALRSALESTGERVLVFAHLSHVYRDGASVYVTYLFRRAADPDETVARWHSLKAAASQVVVARGGTISHQHGVGIDHAAYLPAEKGALGIRALQEACRTFDPQGRMNPGKLLVQD